MKDSALHLETYAPAANASVQIYPIDLGVDAPVFSNQWRQGRLTIAWPALPNLTSAAASQLADKLVQSGLIERIESPEDRRAKLLTLSVKGKNLIERGVEERYRWMDKLAVEMNPQDQKKVTNALVILTEAARKLEQT